MADKGAWIHRFQMPRHVAHLGLGREVRPARRHPEHGGHARPVGAREVQDGAQRTRLSGVLWGFLNTCLKGEAHTVFEGADTLQGLEGWRLVVQDIQRGRGIRIATLRKLVKHPPHINKLEDVANGMLKYQNILKEYKAVDGILPSAQEQKSDLLDTLPQELRENLMWRATNKPDETLTDFQNHIRTTVNEILFHRGKLPSPVNNVDLEPLVTEQNQDKMDRINDLEGMLGAMTRRMGLRPPPEAVRIAPRQVLALARRDLQGHQEGRAIGPRSAPTAAALIPRRTARSRESPSISAPATSAASPATLRPTAGAEAAAARTSSTTMMRAIASASSSKRSKAGRNRDGRRHDRLP